jgi:hypothetical protein
MIREVCIGIGIGIGIGIVHLILLMLMLSDPERNFNASFLVFWISISR